jgi:hypothetical protein
MASNLQTKVVMDTAKKGFINLTSSDTVKQGSGAYFNAQKTHTARPVLANTLSDIANVQAAHFTPLHRVRTHRMSLPFMPFVHARDVCACNRRGRRARSQNINIARRWHFPY